MNISLKYIYIYIYIYYLFVFKDLILVRKKKSYISKFVNLKYLIHENVLTFLIGLLAYSLLLIIFSCPKPW